MSIKSLPRRTRIEDIRREELISAAYRIFRQFASLLNGLWLQKGQFNSLSRESAILILTDYTENTLGKQLMERLKASEIFAA